jgi:hypothetical protein
MVHSHATGTTTASAASLPAEAEVVKAAARLANYQSEQAANAAACRLQTEDCRRRRTRAVSTNEADCAHAWQKANIFQIPDM